MRPITLFLSLIVFIGTAAAVLTGSQILTADAAGALPGQTKALWVFGGSVVPNPVSSAAGRSRLVQASSADGIDTLYVSTFQSTPSSSGRFMYEDADMSALNASAHAMGQQVWVAHGNPDWPTFGCTAADRPVQRIQDIVNFNNSVPVNERFDGVMLDVEPGGAFDVATYAAMHQCLRSVLPASIKLGTAINAFWDDPVEYPAGGGIVKPEFAHIIDLPLDKIVVMGYRDTAGTSDCGAGDGLICLDQDEIDYASSIGKTGIVLVGLETLNVDPGQPEKVSFYEEGLSSMNSEAALATAHFSGETGYGGLSIHNYSSSYLSGLAGWPVPSVVGACSSGNNVDVEATSGTASAGYATLKLAFDAINAGTHTGTINIEICANTDEGTTSAILNSSGAGSALYDSINIYPLADGLTISGAMPTGRGVIELNGADNVTIDGDNPLTAGTNRDLTIQNAATNTTTYGQVIRIALNNTTVASANGCTFKNLSMIGNASGRNISGAVNTSGSENTSYGIYVSGAASGAASAPLVISSTGTTIGTGATASGLTISNNLVTNAARAIALQGSAQSVFPNLVVENNVIGNPTAGSSDQVYSMGITVQGSTGGMIRSNTVYVESFVSTPIRGIDIGGVTSSAAAITIENNRILRVHQNNPQTRGAYGINLNGGSNHIVINNFVADVRNDQTSGAGAFTITEGSVGIRVLTGNGHDILHNSINLVGTVPGTSGSTFSAALAVSGSSNSGLDVRNNIFSNQLTGGNPAGITHAAIYLPSGATLGMDALLNNNAYYQGSDARSRLAQVGSTFGSGEYLAADFDAAAITPAANFRSYTRLLNGDGTNDDASFAVTGAPPFVSSTDLHVSGSTPLESGGAGAGVGTDIDGDSRNATTPDIGADEFNGVAANQPPVITSTAPTAATEDILLTYNATSTDADGPGANWSLLPAHTCGGSIGAATGVLTFTIGGPVPQASCTLAIQVCDGGSPSLCASQSTTVNIAAVNDPPAITSSAPTAGIEDTLYTYNGTFTDPDGTGAAWSLDAAHTCGGSVDPGTGIFTFTPAGPVPAASCVVSVKVCDDALACSAVQSTTVNIDAVNDGPIIDSSAPTTATEDVPYSYDASVLDPDGPDELWSLLPANTCGGSIDAGTGLFTFTLAGPVPDASCIVAVQVCDGAPASLCATQSTTVNVTAVNDPPTITSSAPATASEDVPYIYDTAFSDPDGTGSTWEIVAPTHTCGGSIDAAGQFTFTPTGPVPPASCVIAIRVCDDASACSAVQMATVTIDAVNDAPTAVDDNFATPQGVAFIVAGDDLASNDIDADGPGLSVTAVLNPVNGTVGLSAGSVTFTPDSGFSGTAGFDYTVSDGLLTDTGHVTVTVTALSFSGALSVGTGETIDSLTNDGGLFDQMNSGTIAGNVVVSITSDLTAETGTHALNQLAETGGGGYTVFFQASGGARLIEGSNPTALITLNGADRVSFSGLAFGPGGLVFRNTGGGATFRFINDATDDSILNCRVEGDASSNTSGVVFIGIGSAAGNDNISISGNTIRDRTDAAGVPVNLIYNNGLGGAAANSNMSAVNNQLINYTETGIFAGAAEDSIISGNLIQQTVARATGLFAIQLVANSGTNSVTQNSIRDHSTSSTFVGLNLQGNAGAVNVSRNRIFNIENRTGGSVPLNGVQISGSDLASVVTLENNMISIAPSTPSSQLITGVLDTSSAGTINMNYNSVLIGGASTGTDTFAFRRGPGSVNSVSLVGNILFNGRMGGGSNFAAGDSSANLGSWSSDYNIYVGTGAVADEIFEYGASAAAFAAWQAGPPARDAHSAASASSMGPFNVGNLFASTNDLHLRTIGNNPAINAGIDIGLAIDFDGQSRPFNGTPDIGADEVQTATTAADAAISGRVITADGRGIRNVRIIISGGALTKPILAVTSNFGYFRVDGLRAGDAYVVNVSGKRYTFDTPTRFVWLTEDALDINFLGERR